MTHLVYLQDNFRVQRSVGPGRFTEHSTSKLSTTLYLHLGAGFTFLTQEPIGVGDRVGGGITTTITPTVRVTVLHPRGVTSSLRQCPRRVATACIKLSCGEEPRSPALLSGDESGCSVHLRPSGRTSQLMQGRERPLLLSAAKPATEIGKTRGWVECSCRRSGGGLFRVDATWSSSCGREGEEGCFSFRHAGPGGCGRGVPCGWRFNYESRRLLWSQQGSASY